MLIYLFFALLNSFMWYKFNWDLKVILRSWICYGLFNVCIHTYMFICICVSIKISCSVNLPLVFTFMYVGEYKQTVTLKHITMPDYINTIQTNSNPQTHHYASLYQHNTKNSKPKHITMPHYINKLQTNSNSQTHHYASLYQHNTNKQKPPNTSLCLIMSTQYKK